MRLQNKVTVITGGSTGIGRAIAIRFVQEGAKVAIAGLEDQLPQELEEQLLAAGGDILYVKCNVQYKQDVQRMIAAVIERWGTLDVLVNNAGINRVSPFLELEEADWDEHMAVNLKGTFLASQAAAREMVRLQVKGSIINISSVNGLAAEGDQAHYNASKGGINLLTMSMAVDLGALGIRANALCPGFIKTRLTMPLIDNPDAIGPYLQTIPMGRVGVPEEIADSALFLASDDSRYMTGHCMVVDGGQFIKLS